jgi:hypothetical protein
MMVVLEDFVPNYNSFSNYAKRIVYRAGLKYDKTGLIVKSESINDLGFTLGLGLPITGSFSNITLVLKWEKENYFFWPNSRKIANLSIGSLNDRWFEKSSNSEKQEHKIPNFTLSF